MNKGTNKYAYNGELHTILEWAKMYGMSRDALRSRLARGWDIEKALAKPVKGEEVIDIKIKESMKKVRFGRFVIYDIEYLLRNLSQEVYLLECEKRCPRQVTAKELKEMVKC